MAKDKRLEKRMNRILIRMERASKRYDSLRLIFRSLVESTPYEAYYDSKFKNNYKNEMFV